MPEPDQLARLAAAVTEGINNHLARHFPEDFIHAEFDAERESLAIYVNRAEVEIALNGHIVGTSHPQETPFIVLPRGSQPENFSERLDPKEQAIRRQDTAPNDGYNEKSA